MSLIEKVNMRSGYVHMPAPTWDIETTLDQHVREYLQLRDVIRIRGQASLEIDPNHGRRIRVLEAHIDRELKRRNSK